MSKQGKAIQFAAQRLAGPAAWALLTQVTHRGSLVLASIWIARHLDVAAFASYSYFVMTVSLLSTYASMGMSVAASRLLAEAKSHSSEVRIDPPLVALALACGGLTFIAASGVFFLPEAVLGNSNDMPRPLVAVAVGVCLLQSITSGAVMGLGLFRPSAFVGVGSALVMLGGTMVAALMASPEVAMATFVAAMTTQAVGEIALVMKNVRVPVSRPQPDWQAFRSVLSMSVPALLTSLLAATGPWVLGRMLLGQSNGEFEFAKFSIALQWFSLTLLLPGVISRAALPEVVRLLSLGETSGELKRMLRGAVGFCALSAILIWMAAAAGGSYLIGLYGADYGAALPVALTLMAGAIVASASNTLGNVIVMGGGQWRWLGLSCAWLSLLVGAAFMLIDHGAWGAAAAFVPAYAVVAAVAALTLRRAGYF